jgi:putative transposase
MLQKPQEVTLFEKVSLLHYLPAMKKRDTEALQPDYLYHVFARTNNREPLFASDENYRFFLRRYTDFILPVAKTYAYALLENHVHFLIKMRDEEALRGFCEAVNQERDDRSDTFQKSVTSVKPESIGSYQFQRFFTSYAKAFNKQQGRYGNLIQRPFKRKAVADDSHFFQLVYYIHNNARKHGYTTDFRTYKWSSYLAFVSDEPTKLERAEMLELFGGREQFIAFHAQFLEDQDWEFE